MPPTHFHAFFIFIFLQKSRAVTPVAPHKFANTKHKVAMSLPWVRSFITDKFGVKEKRYINSLEISTQTESTSASTPTQKDGITQKYKEGMGYHKRKIAR